MRLINKLLNYITFFNRKKYITLEKNIDEKINNLIDELHYLYFYSVKDRDEIIDSIIKITRSKRSIKKYSKKNKQKLLEAPTHTNFTCTHNDFMDGTCMDGCLTDNELLLLDTFIDISFDDMKNDMKNENNNVFDVDFKNVDKDDGIDAGLFSDIHVMSKELSNQNKKSKIKIPKQSPILKPSETGNAQSEVCNTKVAVKKLNIK